MLEDTVVIVKLPIIQQLYYQQNSPIHILRTAHISLEIDYIVISDTFYVSPTTNSKIILGNTCLIKNKVELNFEKKR